MGTERKRERCTEKFSIGVQMIQIHKHVEESQSSMIQQKNLFIKYTNMSEET